MRSAISDSVSAGLFTGIGNGQFDLGASLLANKSLHASQNATFDLFYGLSASKE